MKEEADAFKAGATKGEASLLDGLNSENLVCMPLLAYEKRLVSQRLQANFKRHGKFSLL